MRKRTQFVVGFAALAAAVVFAAETAKHNFKPKDGYVPDAKTAIRIAVAIWEPIYGEKQIAREKPFTARLDTNGVWIVEGRFRRVMLAASLSLRLRRKTARF